MSKVIELIMKSKTLILIVVLICQIGFLSCTSTPWHRDMADAQLKKGMALIEAGQYIGALKELIDADKNAPNDPVINYYLGIAYHGRGLRDLAMERFQKAIYLKKDYSEAYNFLGVIYMDMGQWDKAISYFDHALANHLYGTPALALYNSGWAHYNLQNYDVALSKYQEALRQDRTSVLQPQIEKNIGLIYVRKNNLILAVQHFKKAVALDASLYDAHYFLAESYLKIKDSENAKKSFRQVVTLAPQSAFGQKAREYLQSF
jgi:Tfp pilus assembly protein PilF